MPNNLNRPRPTVERARSTVRIDDLHIRVPGMSRNEAQRLGEQVAEHLRDGFPNSTRSTNIGSLNVRLPHQSGASGDRLARTIAENIMRRIG